MTPPKNLSVNGRTYAWPDRPLVIVCIDGSQPEYMEKAMACGAMPYLSKMLARGADLRGRCVIPSFTNPNNLSIVTGVPPAVHGISGNFFLDTQSGQEVMMNDPKLLRTQTLFKAFHDAGAKITIVTAKDKLRRLLGHGLDYDQGRAVCFSSEKADETTLAENGIDNAQALVGRAIPNVYSADLSEFIFAAGVKLMDSLRPDILYLSTTDYIQHKHAPGTPVANEFYRMMDGYWAQLEERGVTLGLTADHGMNAKHNSNGQPNVIFLQDVLDEMLGTERAHVILPITDPYVVHHGALGSFATAYLAEGVNASSVVEQLNGMDGVERAYTNEEGCALFELPPDRMGDLMVVSERHHVLGLSPHRHDLTQLKEPLRSHGGVCDQEIPLVFNRPLSNPPNHPLRNFDVFDLALNHVDGTKAQRGI